MSTSRPLYKSTSYERPAEPNFLGKLDSGYWQQKRFLQTTANQLRVSACCLHRASAHREIVFLRVVSSRLWMRVPIPTAPPITTWGQIHR